MVEEHPTRKPARSLPLALGLLLLLTTALALGFTNAAIQAQREAIAHPNETHTAPLSAALFALAPLAALALAWRSGRVRNARHREVAERVWMMSKAPRRDREQLAPIRLHGFDDTAALCVSFNRLQRRYLTGEQSYQEDLRSALEGNRDRAAFLAAVSHELYTPLNALLGFADVLLAEVDGPLNDEARSEVEMVRQSAQQLRKLIDDIVEFSAIAGGQLQLSPQPTSLQHALCEVREQLAPLLRERDATLPIDGADTHVYALDRARFIKALTQLLENGIYTQSSTRAPKIEVRASDERTQLLLCGCGPELSAEAQALIFSTLVPERSSKASGLHGSGLSMALARKSLELQGAEVSLLNHAERGVTFVITLPAALRRDATEHTP